MTNKRRRMHIVQQAAPPRPSSRTSAVGNRPADFNLIVIDRTHDEMYFVNPSFIDNNGVTASLAGPLVTNYTVNLPGQLERLIDTGSAMITFSDKPGPNSKVRLHFDKALDQRVAEVLLSAGHVGIVKPQPAPLAKETWTGDIVLVP